MTRTQRGSETFQEPTVQPSGHRIYVRDYPGEGDPILLMHGFPDNLHLYDRVVPHLTPTRRVVTFDFLGWGASDKPASYRPTARNPPPGTSFTRSRLSSASSSWWIRSSSSTMPPARPESTGHFFIPIAWQRSCCSTRTTRGRRVSDALGRWGWSPHR